MKAEIRDDLLPMLSCAKLKSPERSELRDDQERQSYLGGSVLRARSSFWNGSEVMEAFACSDTCHHPVRVRF